MKCDRKSNIRDLWLHHHESFYKIESLGFTHSASVAPILEAGQVCEQPHVSLKATKVNKLLPIAERVPPPWLIR